MIRKELRPAQLEAVARWHTRTGGGFGFFHEPRVGKTLPALKVFDDEKPPQLLVVTRKKGVGVWKKEIAESLDLSNWAGPPEIRIYHFQQLLNKNFHQRLRKWARKRPTLTVIDEAHRIKRRGSRWSKRCRSLGKVSKFRLALTGTPIAQGIQDAWAVFDFIDPQIFGPWQITKKIPRPGAKPRILVIGGFQHRYLIMDEFWRRKVIGTQNEEEFYEIFHQHCARSTLNEARRDAGQKSIRVYRRTLTDELGTNERRHYDRLEAELETYIRGERISATRVITLSLKLQQICGGFILDENKRVHRLGSTKLKLLEQALDVLEKKRKRPVIVCRYLAEMAAIERLLLNRLYTVKRIAGGIEFDPNERIEETAILLQIQSGEAIDLAVFDCLIYYSWNYSHIDHEQSKFRVLSFFTSSISYYYLVIKNSIDELILEATRSKKRFADLVCDHYRRR